MLERIIAAVFPPLVAVALLSMLGYALIRALSAPLPTENKELILMMVTAIVGATTGALVGYLWGSSQGSRNKDAAIASLATEPTRPPTSPTT